MRTVLALLVLLVFISGCVIGGDSTAIAQEMRALRVAQVPNGLLVPATLDAREHYQNDLLAFRSRVPGGNSPLSAYLSGSLDLIALQNENDTVTTLLRQINPELVECGPNTNAGKAIVHLQAAQKAAESAENHFEQVQNSGEVANALGAEYVLNARTTTQAIITAHAARVEDLKAACGQI